MTMSKTDRASKFMHWAPVLKYGNDNEQELIQIMKRLDLPQTSDNIDDIEGNKLWSICNCTETKNKIMRRKYTKQQ